MNKDNKAYFPIVLLFLFLNAVLLVFKKLLEQNSFDSGFLLWANVFLFILSIGGFLLQRRGLHSPNPQAFVRGVYSSMIFKMFITMAVVLIYVFIVRSKINKPSLFTAMGLYIVYTIVEVKMLTKLVRKKKNA